MTFKRLTQGKKENKAKTFKVVICSAFFLSFIFFSLVFISALPNDAGTSIDFIYPTNFSLVNTNNSLFLGGFPESAFVHVEGDTMTGDLIINADLNVSNPTTHTRFNLDAVDGNAVAMIFNQGGNGVWSIQTPYLSDNLSFYSYEMGARPFEIESSTGKGFFLGDLRVGDDLEVTDNLDVGGDLNVTGLIYGNGSQLTDIAGDNESWNESLANTLYKDIDFTNEFFNYFNFTNTTVTTGGGGGGGGFPIPKAYWWLDGSAIDMSLNEHNGTVLGGVTNASGVVGNASAFDGVNGYIAIPDSQDFNFSDYTQPWTMGMWVYPTDDVTTQGILSIGIANYQTIQLGFSNADKLQLFASTTGSAWDVMPTSSQSIVLNTWQHVIVRNDGAGTVDLFINGSIDGTDSVASDFMIGNVSAKIGAHYSLAGTWYADGILDEVFIINESLSNENITTIFNEQMTGIRGGLGGIHNNSKTDIGCVGNWWLDGNATDVSGEGNDGTVSGGVTNASGVVGNAYDFDGTDGIVDIGGRIVASDIASVTVLGWVKTDSTATGVSSGTVYAEGTNSGTYPGVWVNIGVDTAGEMQTWATDDWIGSATSDVIFNDGAWHHFAMKLIDGVSVEFFKDGVSYQTVVDSDVDISYASHEVTMIGSQLDTRFFNGGIDEILIFNRSLSPTEISNIYEDYLIGRDGGGGGGTSTSTTEVTASRNLTMQNHSIFSVEYLVFRLGEFIDNLVDGWLRVTGSFKITENLVVEGTTNLSGDTRVEGDINFTGLIYGNGSQLIGIVGDNSSWNESFADSLYINVEGDTMTGNLNMSDNNITDVSVISFSLGEYMDNLVNGWIRIAGSLNVTEKITGMLFHPDAVRDDKGDLIGYYPFDDCNVLDYSSLKDNGTVFEAKCVNGISGRAYEFDGTNDYIGIANYNVTGTDFSFVAWVNPDIDSRIQDIMGYSEIIFKLGENNSLLLTMENMAEEPETLTSNNDSWLINQWNQVVVSYNDTSNVSSFYVNGILAGTDTFTIGERIDLLYNWRIGDPAPVTFFDGKIDEVQIWNKSLSASEISEMYNDIIPNYHNGDLTLSGYFHLGTDSRGTFSRLTDAGDISAGRLTSDGAILSFAEKYGIALSVQEYTGGVNLSSEGGTANLTAATQYICDSTDPFVEGHEGMMLTVISSTPSFANANGEIETFINSTCIRVSFASAGSDTIVDATDMSFAIYDHPILLVLDNGDVHFLIGENPDANFQIEIPNGTGFTGIYIEDVAGADQHQIMTIDMDIKNYDGIVGLNMFGKSSTGADDISSSFILMESDATGINNSELTYLSFETIGMGGVNNKLDGIKVSPSIDHIIHVGSEDAVSSVYDNEVNITGNVTDGGTREVFTADNDVLYVGSTVNFTTMSFSLETEGSANANLLYWYCNGTDYNLLTPGADTTNGFTKSGGITFSNPTDRGTCNFELDDTLLDNLNNYSYIALQRTRNLIVTQPVLDTVTVAGATDSMVLQKDMMKLNAVDTAPETCDAAILGGIYFDISEDDMCVCKSGGWFVMDDGSACT